MKSFTSQLHATASALALSAAATFGWVVPQPAMAAPTLTINGGGSTLAALAFRRIFNCYDKNPLGAPVASSCTTVVAPVEGLYAAVGSGSGTRAFIANSPKNLLQSKLNLPAVPPPFVDSKYFPSYPYPKLDFGAADSPLPSTAGGNPNLLTTVSNSFTTGFTNWQTFTSGKIIPTIGSTTVSYSTAKYGQPIQVPAFVVPVAIAVNVTPPTTAGVTWQIKSGLTPNTQAGGAIQLTGAQLCAIFSGEVVNWDDQTTNIVSLNNAGTKVSELFYLANSGNSAGHVAPVPYAKGSLPITVVYRSDGSGTSFITTNFLATFCPLLDNGKNNYKKIFTGLGIGGATKSNLPSTSFSNLIDNIKAVTGKDVLAPTYNGGHPWRGFSGSDNVAANVSTHGAQAGEISYLSADYVRPYATTVTGTVNGVTTTVPAPLSASISDDQLRSCGVYHPGDKPTAGACQTALGNKPQNFIPPAPDTALLAWSSLATPATNSTWVGWNVYGQTWPTATKLPGSTTVSIGGLSILPLAKGQRAYPLSGTTFLYLYACYNDPTGKRVPAIRDFLSWYLNTNNTRAILQVGGFSPLPVTFAANLKKEYVSGPPFSNNIAAWKASGPQVNGCVGVTARPGGAL